MGQQTARRWWIFLWSVTLCLSMGPFAFYGLARLTGALPSEAQWASSGSNHGPWWDDTRGTPLYVLWFVLLPLWTLVCVYTSTLLARIEEKVIYLLYGLLLLSFHVLSWGITFYFCAWIID